MPRPGVEPGMQRSNDRSLRIALNRLAISLMKAVS